MATKFNKRKKNLLALFLSLVMVSSAAVSFAACNDEDDTTTDNDTTTSTTETDTARIKNGSFEYGMDEDDATTLIYTSMDGWSKDTTAVSTGSAATSVAASGIIDTEETAWANLTKSALGDDVGEITTAEDAANYWDQMSAFDKLTFYDKWEEGDHDEDVEDLDFYDADTDDFNIDIDKVPDFEVNPGVHEGAKEGDTHVFMIHNKRTNGLGTAQKYASSTTVTVAAGTSATFSVWVKTADLTFNDGSSVNGKMGAYIGVTHTVGGKTLDQFQVKNIDTDEWVQYEFYLRGCSYASSTFTIVLGLGQGGGTQVKEYVQGYAFFDDVTCELIDNDTYEQKTADIGENETVTLSDTGSEKYMLADDTQKDKTRFAIDLYAGFTNYTLQNVSTALTEEKDGGKTYVSGTGKYNTNKYSVYPTLGAGFSTDNDIVGLYSTAALIETSATNTYLESRLVKDFGYDTATKTFGEKYTNLFGSSDVLMFLSVEGASYTAKITDAAFTLAQGERMAISFFLKTSDLKGRTGVTVTARNNADQTDTSVLSSLTTTDITLVDLEEGQENIFDGWQQCFVFVENDTERKSPISFTLEINYGPTSVKTDKTSYYAGYAAITNFQTAEMNEEEYSYISTGTYASSLSLKDPDEDTTTGVKFDNAAVVPSTAIETGLAQLRNYTGVYADSGYVSANGTNDKKNDDKTYAGLFSKDYLDTYAENTDASYWLNVIAASKGISTTDTAAKKTLLTTLLGSSVDAATQPLVIVNNEARAYGFIGATTTLSTETYTTLSYRVKVSEGATATIYLTDTDDLTHESVISIGRQVSYWYDEDGNACVSDPTDEFNPKTDIAFKIQDNGLYAWNEDCEAVNGVKGKLYANLANYERVKDDDGNVNLVVAEGGVQYNYNSDWNNEGMDGIAFYGNAEGTKFYSDKARTLEVLDFADADLAPRYTAKSEDGQQLAVEIVGTKENADKWQTVTFQIHTGATAKNYRVEFWSGNRDGKTSAQGTYVLFDMNTMTTSTAETWTDRMNVVLDKIKDAYGYADEDELKAKYGDIIYNAYSFYDSASFLRYNAELDENEVTNAYDDYNPTDDTLYYDLVSYLRYADENTTTIFVDYAQNDVTVTPDADDDVSDDDDNDDSSSSTTEGDTNIWLLISSIVIAVALIVAVVGLILKKTLAKARREKARQLAANPTSVRKPTKVKKAKAAKPAKKDELKDEGDPYND